MYKKIILTIIFLILLVLTYYYLSHNQIQRYKTKGNFIIDQVYDFKKRNGYLPHSYKDFNQDEEMGEGPYYKKLNDTTFEVYFNIGFDDSIIYNSSTKKWEVKM